MVSPLSIDLIYRKRVAVPPFIIAPARRASGMLTARGASPFFAHFRLHQS
jgi:hypothetical protein